MEINGKVFDEINKKWEVKINEEKNMDNKIKLLNKYKKYKRVVNYIKDL